LDAFRKAMKTFMTIADNRGHNYIAGFQVRFLIGGPGIIQVGWMTLTKAKGSQGNVITYFFLGIEHILSGLRITY
jgi:hypothetical protein